ncbi:MAG TPA: dolichyl-phosphate beta-glucosyltransferase [Candidatus Polarisedimenticolia bacterium]|nr:dolichyl-phosphate beta-glucosyltransferase [Candidatus Polarisedimenticolia bacterium]
MSKEARPQLSVVIPAYNEEARIRDSLAGLVTHLAGLQGGAEILVVDDGSTDGTAAIALEFARRPVPSTVVFRILSNGRNRGKGYSIKHGVLSAAGEFLLLTDADLSTPIEELPRLLRPVAEEGYGIAIGSRGMVASRLENRQPPFREMMGVCFNRLVRWVTGLEHQDTQCGFKVMRREEVLPLFRGARVERFAYDVEILYLARKTGVRVIEVPVTWRHAPGSKVNALRDSFDMLKDVLRIVLRDRRGGYGTLGRTPAPPAGTRPADAAPPRTGGRP